MMKKTKLIALFALAAAVLVLVVAFTACGDSEPTEPTIKSISVDASEAKTEYLIGDKFSSDGVKVFAKMSDDTTKTIKISGCTFSGFNSATATASQTITVTYEGKTATYTVMIKEPPSVAEPVFTGSLSYGGTVISEISLTLHDGGAATLTATGSLAPWATPGHTWTYDASADAYTLIVPSGGDGRSGTTTKSGSTYTFTLSSGAGPVTLTYTSE